MSWCPAAASWKAALVPRTPAPMMTILAVPGTIRDSLHIRITLELFAPDDSLQALHIHMGFNVRGEVVEDCPEIRGGANGAGRTVPPQGRHPAAPRRSIAEKTG